jgi:outer membrane protein OmpA-like peptidoglycan-associated protein
MIKFRALLFFIFLSVSFYSQITIIGHNKLNNEPLKNTVIFVREGSSTTRTLSTKASGDFMLPLEFGKDYRIYFQNAKSPLIFMEVIASNVPEEKRAYKMLHEMNVAFFDKNDEDVDTMVFREPFQRIIFDGKTKMIDDSAYQNGFRQRILKPSELPENSNVRSLEAPVIIAGKIITGGDPRQPVSNKSVSIINKKGQAVKSTFTNRFGSFVFTGIHISDISKIKLELKGSEEIKESYTLLDMADQSLAAARPENSNCLWELSPSQLEKLINDRYTTNIGGKLVVSSAKQKKFFANKTVYLCNKFNTVLKKTTTNMLGTFVFEDIRPGNSYYIGVDRHELGAGEKVDVLNKDEKFIMTLDTLAGGRASSKINSTYNRKFNDMSINDDEMIMSVNATIYGDNTNNPIGKLKVVLLNDAYQVIDSALTDDLGAFKFKYLPFLKRFYLSAENDKNMLDAFTNILIYNKEYNLIKIMTHEKGRKISYKPVNAEIFRLREVEIEDPWLELMGDKKINPVKKIIIENILFESEGYAIKPSAREILDKVVLVLQTNKTLKIEVGAHTDNQGSEEYNLKLSQLRAKTVLNYITKAGIDPKRVISKGYGESKPINTCNPTPCTESEHAKNRRIEFIILEE